MELSIIFLISCVITARFFNKRRMRAAATAYSIMFIVLLFVLIFSADIPIVQTALKNAMGEVRYAEARDCISDAMNTTLYGVSMLGVMGALFAVQVIATLLNAARAVVGYCFTKKSLARKFKKACFGFASAVRILYLPKRINLLYCRMLN